MIKKLILAFVIVMLVVPTALARPLPEYRGGIRHGKQHMRIGKIVPNWRFFIAIGRCEQPAPAGASGKRYKWGIDWHQTRNGSYPGGLGIWEPLWHEKGIAGTDMAPTADRATPRQQMIQAQRIVNRYGVYAWGCTGVALSQAPYLDLKK